MLRGADEQVRGVGGDQTGMLQVVLAATKGCVGWKFLLTGVGPGSYEFRWC